MNTAPLHQAFIFITLSLGVLAHNDHIWARDLLQLLANNGLNRIGKISRINLLKGHYLSVIIGYPDMNALGYLEIEGNSTISAL